MPLLLEKQAELLLKYFTELVYKSSFAGRVISIFKFGSLGNRGDFSLCSDVDVALMLENIVDSDFEAIQILWNTIKATNFEFADRFSLFWSSYNRNDFNRGIGRMPPLDRSDLIRHGILISGDDRLAELPFPSHRDIVLASAEFIITNLLSGEKLNQLILSPDKITAQGARYFTKFVLFPVRLIYTLDCPDQTGSNKDAVEHFNKTFVKIIPESAEIINLAYALRQTPANSPLMLQPFKLWPALLSLYSYCIKRYKQAVTELGSPELVSQLDAEERKVCAAKGTLRC